MIRAFRKLHQFYRGFDGAADCLEQTIGKSVCQSGCGKCCEANIPKCMTIEAINAISILLGEGKFTQTVSIAEGWLLERNNEAPTYEGMPSGRFITTQLRLEYEALAKQPCPFLAETKQCLIHSARPLICRSFGVTRTGGGFCPRMPGKGETLTQHMYIQAPGLQQDIRAFKEFYQVGHPEWIIFGFLPALIYRAAEENKFRNLVRDNRIASAKLIGTQLDTTLMWEPQEEALSAGMAPDLVAAMV